MTEIVVVETPAGTVVEVHEGAQNVVEIISTPTPSIDIVSEGNITISPPASNVVEVLNPSVAYVVQEPEPQLLEIAASGPQGIPGGPGPAGPEGPPGPPGTADMNTLSLDGGNF